MSSKKQEFSLIPTENSPKEIESSISTISQPLANLLEHAGLPTENILSPVSERRKVIHSLESTLEILPIEERQKATYLSKFTISITIGLFDGALNFLWDETVEALRRVVISFDILYFFNIAESLSPRYKNLSSEKDLEAISEHDLLEICRRIGLVTNINHKRLEHVNYLRNHASAAHPNDNEISGIEMLSLLENCLKYAITAKPDHSVIQIQQLLHNIRTNEIPDEDFPLIGEDILKQPQERIDDFLISITGIYCDPKQDVHIKTNIEKIIPYVWDGSLDETKYHIGSKFGLYRKNGDTSRKDSIQKILEIVDGLKFKDEDSLAAELMEKLQILRSVHFDWNNFYNEYPHAKSIDDSIPPSGIPKSIRKFFVKIITICYCGNGLGYKEGVDESAVTYYIKYIKLFETSDIKIFLKLFSDNEFVGDLDKKKADKRMRKLAKHLDKKSTNVHIKKLLDLIINFPKKKLPKITMDKQYKESIKFI